MIVLGKGKEKMKRNKTLIVVDGTNPIFLTVVIITITVITIITISIITITIIATIIVIVIVTIIILFSEKITNILVHSGV
jgi:hypothetical protein